MFKTKYEKYLLASVSLLFIYMPFHVFVSQWLSTYTGGLDVWKVWKDILTALVTILCVVTVFGYKKYTKLYKNLLIFIGLYIVIHLIIGFVTDQPTQTFLLAIVYNLRIFCYLLIGYSLVLVWPKKELFVKYKRLLIILSSVVCLLAILQWLLPKDILANFGYSVGRGVKPNFFIDDKTDLPRVFSTLRDPNSLGAFLILPIVFLSQSLMANWRTEKRMMMGGLLILHVWVLLLTFSRSTLLATVLAVLALLFMQNMEWLSRHKNKVAVVLAIFCIVVVSFVYLMRDQYVVQNVVFHADENTALEDPNSLRQSFARQAVDGIIDQPFGHGPGTAGLVSTRLPDGLLTENYYLQILYEVGVFGFLTFIVIIWLVVRDLWQRRKISTNKAMLAGFVGIGFACMLFHTLSNEAVAISVFMLAGLSLRVKD